MCSGDLLSFLDNYIKCCHLKIWTSGIMCVIQKHIMTHMDLYINVSTFLYLFWTCACESKFSQLKPILSYFELVWESYFICFIRSKLRVNVRQFRIKTRWGITNVSFGLKYHFPDLHHIHENSAETLGSKYSIVNLLKNTQIWSFLCHYHSLAQRWTLLLKQVMYLELLEN